MHEKDELDSLESLYRAVMPERRILPGEQEDQKILNLARNQISSSVSEKVVSLQRYRKARAVWSGLAIAAGLLMGIVINPIADSIRDPHGLIDSQMLYMGEGPNHQAVALEELNAEELQTLIAELVLRGEIENAEALLAYFMSRYPNFGDKE